MIAHILTKNNQQTIQNTLESIKHCDEVLIADLGSTDQTISIAQQHGAKVHRFPGAKRNDARNSLQHSDGWNFYIEPWEIFSQGHKPRLEGNACYVSILQENIICKEIRYWKGKQRFIHPVYELLDIETDHESSSVFYSLGRTDLSELETEVEKWRLSNPTMAAPYYYKACLLLSKGMWEDFLQVSEHYMFLERSKSISAIMNRYYFAMGQLIHKRKAIPALKNLNLCLCEKPLMSEFWCLLGDVYYHLLKNFKDAREFYENAIILGSRRPNNDHWPMDISKYRKYPEKMIASCDSISAKSGLFGN